MNPEREFKGVFIPKSIYLNKCLSWTEKILLVEIDSLSKNDKGCFASDQYLSEHLQVTEKTVSNLLSKLKKDGLITTIYDHKAGRTIMTNLNALKTLTTSRKRELPTSRKNEVPLPENGKTTSRKNEVPINMYSNTEKNTEEEYSLPPKKTAASSLSPSKQETEKQALIKFLEIGIKNSALLAMCEGIDQTLPEIREKFSDYWFGLERSFTGSEGDKRYVKNSLAKWAEGEAVNSKKSNEKAPIRFDDKLEKVCEVFKFYSPRSQSEIRKEVALTIAKKLFKDGVTIEELDIEMSKIEFLGSDFRDIDGFFQRWEKVVKIRPESWEMEYGIKGSAKPVTKYQRKNGAA